jgi:hypothetical protein
VKSAELSNHHRAGRERAEEIDLRKELDVITRTDGTRFHEVLTGVPREAGAHEHVQHIVDIAFYVLRWLSGA